MISNSNVFGAFSYLFFHFLNVIAYLSIWPGRQNFCQTTKESQTMLSDMAGN